MDFSRRPNRSDVHLSAEEEAKAEQQTRRYFDGLAPHRHTKPQRSEYASQYVDSFAIDDHHSSIPELDEFQRLENDPQLQKIVFNGKEVSEEFVETGYYNDLNCIGKQHHATGTGFIKMENANGKCFSLKPDSAPDHHTASAGNPATNDWIPATVHMEPFASDKPSRSDS